MNKEIEMYFNEMIEKYGDDNVIVTASDIDHEKLKQMPKALTSLYKLASEVELPFGEIFTLETALEESEENPFKPDWFAFGHDNYFSYWLCRFEPDDKGLSFTSWDHECPNIGKAVFADIVSFFKDAEEEAEERNSHIEEDDE